MKPILFKFFFLLFFTNSLLLNAQSYSWTQKANFSGGVRYGGFCFSIGSKGYTGSGLTSTAITYSNDFWEYDPSTDIWTQKANFGGVVRHGASNFTIGDKGYVCNGWSSSVQLNDLWEYNPLSNVWSAKSSFPGSPRYTCADFVIYGKAYVGMGYSPLKSDFYCYDPSSDSWTSIAPIPGPARQSAEAFSINNFGYVIGGASSSQFLKTVYKYDPLSNTWQQLSNYPGQGSYAFSVFVLNNTAYAGMGAAAGVNYSDFYRYNDQLDTWTAVASFGGGNRAAAISTEINGKGYVGLGAKVFQSNYQLDWWEFNACTAYTISIKGDPIVCPPSQNNIYSVSPLTPGVSYNWTVPAGATIVSGQGKHSINVSYANNAVAGTICVTATNACGSSSVVCFTTILRSAKPPTPGVITGSTNGCSGESKLYTIRKVSTADYYIWTPPPGATINGSSSPLNTIDTAVTVTYTASFTGDSVRVQSGNCRGVSAIRRLRINHNAPATPGTISGPINGLCLQNNKTYSINPVTNATSYTWRTNIVGASINGSSSPVITPLHFVNLNFASFVSGQIYVKANNGCGSGAERTLTVYARPDIPLSITGPLSVCDGQLGVAYSSTAVANASSYNWTIPSGATFSSGQGTTAISVNFGATPATGNVRVRAQNSCANSSYRTLSVTINNCPRLGEIDDDQIFISPNPFTNEATLYIPDALKTTSDIIIYNVLGKAVRRISGEQKTQILISKQELNSGIYILRFIADDGEHILRFMIQ
jgi:N-acetylneuraminic acid mutarotase